NYFINRFDLPGLEEEHRACHSWGYAPYGQSRCYVSDRILHHGITTARSLGCDAPSLHEKVIIVAKREKGVSQHILTDETGGRQGHFFGFAVFTAAFFALLLESPAVC